MFSTSIATAANMGAPSIGSRTTRAGPRAVKARSPLAKILSATLGCSRSRASDSRERFNLNKIWRSPTRRGAVIGMAWTSSFCVLSHCDRFFQPFGQRLGLQTLLLRRNDEKLVFAQRSYRLVVQGPGAPAKARAASTPAARSICDINQPPNK